MFFQKLFSNLTYANGTHGNASQEDMPKIKYPEALFIVFSVPLLTWYFEAKPLSLLLFVVTVIPSVIICVYHLYKPSSFWSNFTLIFLLAVIAGSVKLAPTITIALAALIFVRVLQTKAAARLLLVSMPIVTAGFLYFLVRQLRPDSFEVALEISWVSYAILIASFITITWQFWQAHNQFVSNSSQAYKAKLRVNTLVAVISKLIRFVPPQVWQPIVKNNADIRITNKRAKLTIMFSDIAGFTELSDTLSADNLADILNTYMERMTLIANRHGATLDKFIGDGMMCFFGEPDSKGSRQDALDCVAMAIDMRREMRTLRHQWRLLGFEGLYIRIGITTGYCHVGNFGSDSRMSYTLIGREVNLASRLEAAAKKGQILISDSTYDYICHEYECEHPQPLTLKGFDAPVNAWQVLDPDANKGTASKWVDYDLPGFNLHLNFKDIKNFDYPEIKKYLNDALKQVESEANNDMNKNL